MKKIQVGVIGIGFIGAAHIEALKRLANVEVNAICDDRSIIKTKSEQLGIDKYYSDYKSILVDPEIDSVHICTPNHLHFNMVKDALNAGKHVICEKPLTTTKEESQELVILAKNKKLINAVNFNIRFYPMIHQLKEMITAGDLGNIFSIHGSYLQDWLFFDTDYNWRLDPKMSGKSRAVADIGSHWMDVVEFISELKIKEVFADFATFHKTRKKPLKEVETYSGKLLSIEDYAEVPVNTEDYATILFKFENGTRGNMTVSQVSAGRKNRIYFEIDGSKKSAAWNSEMPNQMWIGKRDGNNELMMKDPSLFNEAARKIIDFPGGHNEGFPDTFKKHFESIYRCIKEGEFDSSYASFESGLREITLCEKIIESNEKRSWVPVE